MNITILGSGAFGIALATAFQKNNITIWSKFKEEIDAIKNKYPYQFTNNLKDAINNTNIIIIAIPIEFIEETLKELKIYYHNELILIASKGIATKNNLFAYQILEKTIPNANYGILSGGTFAKDMIDKKLMGITLATNNKDIEKYIPYLKSKNLRIELTNDIIGVSICGSIKNIIAIAYGLLDGNNYPESTKFFFLTEAIKEIQNIIIELKGKKETILTYAGIDDIIMTSTSSKSRNYTLGYKISKKENTEEYIKTTTIEGLGTSKSFYNLMIDKKINSPIFEIIYQILHQKKDPKILIEYLETI